jgi:ubiquinone/menaquinone biosynthesis C-methylase UbiE
MSEATYVRIISECIPDVEFHQNVYAKRLAEVISAGMRWLDVGSGSRLHNGYGVPSPKELAARCREVIGLDFEREHLAQNEALSSFVVGGGDAIPFPDNRFELITANMVLEHLENPAAVFSEIHRVLTPGGRFVFVTPNKHHPLVRCVSLFLRPATQRVLAHRIEGRPLEHIFPTFYRANTVETIHTLATTTGFKAESVSIVRNIPFLTGPALATWLECQFIRATALPPLRGMGADIVGTLSKPA